MRSVIIALSTLFLLTAAASTEKDPENLVLTMVPRGRIVEQLFREYTVKTKAGTKIRLELERDGSFQEAKGLNLNQGDDFEPGAGLISLSSIAQAVSKLGHSVKGPWTLEKDSKLGWLYELRGEDDGETVTYLVDAATGKLVNFELLRPTNSSPKN